tara:strand:+ start:7 stop:396 length:390 start_codon:yes stop_codon:yes gene_type:complete
MPIDNEKKVIFGCGKGGKNSYNYLRDKSNIIAFCDNDPKKWNKKLFGIRIVSPSDLIKLDFNEIIISSQQAYKIKIQLLEKGIPMNALVIHHPDILLGSYYRNSFVYNFVSYIFYYASMPLFKIISFLK